MQPNNTILALGPQLLYAVLDQPRNFVFVSPQAAKAAAQLTGFSGTPYGTNFMELMDLGVYLSVRQGAYLHLCEIDPETAAQIDITPEGFYMKNLRLPKGFFSHSRHTYVQRYSIDLPLDNDRFPGCLVYPSENEVRCMVDRIRVLGCLHDKWRQ